MCNLIFFRCKNKIGKDGGLGCTSSMQRNAYYGNVKELYLVEKSWVCFSIDFILLVWDWIFNRFDFSRQQQQQQNSNQFRKFVLKFGWMFAFIKVYTTTGIIKINVNVLGFDVLSLGSMLKKCCLTFPYGIRRLTESVLCWM